LLRDHSWNSEDMAHAPPRLREARQAAGLTQVALAERIGVKQPHVARWETGRVEPGARTAIKIARAVNAKVEDVWGDDREVGTAA
jgi:DNA-binding XRE family transcriptional regulator